MDATLKLQSLLNENPCTIARVVDFDAVADSLYRFDLTAENKDLHHAIISDPVIFSNWVNEKLVSCICKYGIGGYLENRTIYSGIPLFETGGEPRFMHLGVDIWADAGTAVYSPLAGKIHSYRDNNKHGDYGPAIILEHNLGGLTVFSLYGHLSRKSLAGLYVGKEVHVGQKIAEFGAIEENGHWPPHLHFQLMFDMEGNVGDYPGACRHSEKEKYVLNVPDPQLLLRLPKAVND